MVRVIMSINSDAQAITGGKSTSSTCLDFVEPTLVALGTVLTIVGLSILLPNLMRDGKLVNHGIELIISGTVIAILGVSIATYRANPSTINVRRNNL